jgi:hypothetical protein
VVTNVEVLRLEPGEVEAAVEELRARIRAAGHRCARWWLPPSVSADAQARLEALGIRPDGRDPVLAGMALASPPPAVAGSRPAARQ